MDYPIDLKVCSVVYPMKTDTHLGFAIKTGLFKSIKCGLIKCCPQAEVVLMCSCNLLVLGLVSL